MASVVYAPAAFRDLDRLVMFRIGQHGDEGLEAARLITEAIAMLQRHSSWGVQSRADFVSL